MDLRYEFTTTAAPVQAEGTVNGRPFYFRARHDEWSFAVSETPGVDPAALETTGGEDRGWVQAGRFAKRFGGSFLSAEDAELIIHACAAAYVHARAT